MKQKKKEEKTQPDEYEPNEAMKAEKIPKFSRKDTVLCNLNPKNKKYSLFYFNFDEAKNIPGDFQKRDLIELLFFLKKKGAKIFVNYYKPVEKKEEKKDEKKEEKKEEKNEEKKEEKKEDKKKKEEEKIRRKTETDRRRKDK